MFYNFYIRNFLSLNQKNRILKAGGKVIFKWKKERNDLQENTLTLYNIILIS